MKKQFLVLGLGRFGKSVLKELSLLGHDVVGCDADPKVLDDNEVSELASYLVEGDAVNPNILDELDVTKFDAVVVSMGDDFESAILIVLALKEMGVTNIYAKANDAKRGKGLQGAGATKVIYPEEETGRRIARNIANPGILQYINIAPHVSGMEVPIPKDFVGKSLVKLDFRRKYNALVILIKKSNQEYPIVSPNPTYEFEEGDSIFIIGDDKDLERFQKHMD